MNQTLKYRLRPAKSAGKEWCKLKELPDAGKFFSNKILILPSVASTVLKL